MNKSSLAVAVLAAALMSGTALARTLDPLPGQAKHFGPVLPPYVAPAGAPVGTWQGLTNAYPGTFPDTALLLTDGTVMMHEGCSRSWFRLKPDADGSYINGTWTATALMPIGYSPLYFASQVLVDGRLIVNGGEYNNCAEAWTPLGAMYNPVSDRWSKVAPPAGWASIGDAQSVVRADRKYMVANALSSELAIATIVGSTTVTWTIKTQADTGKADVNDEEGWTHLPDKTILAINANLNLTGTFFSTEIFNIFSNVWTAGSKITVGRLVETASHEIGPAVLLPSGRVFQFGGTNSSGIYTSATHTWVAGPAMPGAGQSADGPAAVMPNGKILVQLSPGVFQTPSHFYEVTVGTSAATTTFTQVSDPPDAPLISSYEGRMLVLPSGQILWTSDSNVVQIYTPKGSPNSVWLPQVTSVETTLARGSTDHILQGKLLHGLSEGGYYGDDAQMSSNYPLVRFQNVTTGHVCYARTHRHSRMGVADHAGSQTHFDVPAACEAGASTLQVVVNGIASANVAVTLN